MTEKEYTEEFYTKGLPVFQAAFGLHPVRLYMIEFPISTEDGDKSADIVLEECIVDCLAPDRKYNPIYVCEFKREKVDYHSASAQVLRYSEQIRKQLYRKTGHPMVIAPDFAESEIKLANENGVILIRYDNLNNKVYCMSEKKPVRGNFRKVIPLSSSQQT
jgi:hypothetical protein